MEPVASIKQAGADRSFGATLTHLLGASAVFTLRGTGYHGRYQLREYQPGIPAISFSSGSYRGLTLFRNATASDSYLSTRGTLSAVLDVFANSLLSSSDSHAFRIGLEREQAVGEQLSVKPGGLVYTATYNAATGRPRTNYVLKGGDLNLKGVLDRTVVYVQDVWTVGRWRLEPGFRFEKFEGRGYGTGPIWSTNTLAPRLGGTCDLKGDQKHLLKLHWGRYYDGLALAYFDRAVPGAYSVSSQYYWGTGATFAPTDFDITNPEAVPYSPTPYRTATDTNNSKDSEKYLKNTFLAELEKRGMLAEFNAKTSEYKNEQNNYFRSHLAAQWKVSGKSRCRLYEIARYERLERANQAFQ